MTWMTILLGEVENWFGDFEDKTLNLNTTLRLGIHFELGLQRHMTNVLAFDEEVIRGLACGCIYALLLSNKDSKSCVS